MKGKWHWLHRNLRVKCVISLSGDSTGNFYSSHSRIFFKCKLVPDTLLQSFPADSLPVATTNSSIHPLFNSLLVPQLLLLEKTKTKTQKPFSIRMTSNCYVDTGINKTCKNSRIIKHLWSWSLVHNFWLPLERELHGVSVCCKNRTHQSSFQNNLTSSWQDHPCLKLTPCISKAFCTVESPALWVLPFSLPLPATRGW